ncbi:c-type cytochrome [Magnetofaba australis]|nr:c-type cytochrome [Magnetofaba australis]
MQRHWILSLTAFSLAALSLSDAHAWGRGRTGEEIYKTKCFVCHMTGAAGAPKTGDKAAWAPRIATGMDALMHSILNGKNAMPPKGTCMDCSDDELKAAVEYLTSRAK